MRVLSTDMYRVGHMLGPPPEVVLEGVIFLSAENGTTQPSTLFMLVFPNLYRRYSILPALSLDGIIGLEVLDRSFTAATFNKFVEGLLDQMNPWPQKNSVIIMDNASIHKSEELRAMIEDRYASHIN
jgi:DDE superfamily endonuclease